jgi:hypothetical protein
VRIERIVVESIHNRKRLINRIESLPEDKPDEIAHFVEFVETKGK